MRSVESSLSRLLIVTLFAIALPHIAQAESGAASPSSDSGAEGWENEFNQMSIAELVNVEVTTASRKPQKLSDVASAVFVLTDEDIRRSGVTTIPDALRLVPGVNVAQIDRSQYAVSIRGFNGLFSDKLLVLIDGRSVYTPLFSGVFWNEQDLPLEDIERIEVIRGPGATLWGANAVNGVINIITKSADKTHGVLASVGAGKENNFTGTLRYGEKVADTDYRAYFKASVQDRNRLEDGGSAHDDWNSYRAGFRTDTKLSGRDTLTLQGDTYYSESGWDFIVPSLSSIADVGNRDRYINGQNIVGRWTRTLSDTSNLSLQAYWDRIDRDDIVLQQRRNTFDLDGQYRFSPFARNDVLVGAGYRVYHDDHDGTFAASVDPESRTLNLYTAFIQDEITLAPNLLKLTLGTKFEFYQLADPQFLPNVSLAYTPNERNTVWGSVSRAVRNPGRFNKDGSLVSQVLPSTPPTVVRVDGNPDFDSETLIAYELGYRTQVADKASVDVATFYHHYSSLASLEPAGAPGLAFFDSSPYINVPFHLENKLHGRIYGGEVALDVRPFDWWRLVGAFSHFNIGIERDGDSQDAGFEEVERQTSRNQISARSQFNLPHNFEFDTALRYVSSVQAFDISPYVAVDGRIGWHASQNLELSVVAQNLFNSAHIEYTTNLVGTARTEIERALFGRVTYRF